MKCSSTIVTVSAALLMASTTLSFRPSVAPSLVEQHLQQQRRQQQQLFAGLGRDKEGGAAIAKPKVKIGQKTAVVTETKKATVQERKVQTAEPISRREEEFEDAPLYKVVLLGDDDYEQAHVIDRMCVIIEDMDEGNAASIFRQAQMTGKAVCGKYPYEHAEMYKEQLLRSDPIIFSDVQEENKKDDE